MTGLPAITVRLDDASNGGTFPYDITQYVRLADGVKVQRGRGDEFSEVQPSTLNLTLENIDGRFTLGSTVGGYGGALNTDRQIQFKATVGRNLYPDGSFETSESWVAQSGSDNPARDTAQAYVGTYSLKCSRGAGTANTYGSHTITSLLTAGAGTYSVNLRVWISSVITNVGTAGIRLGGTGVTAANFTSTVRDGWANLAFTFVWNGVGTVSLQAWDSLITAGALMYVDAVVVEAGSLMTAWEDSSPAVTTTRFTGFVQNWPVEWPNGSDLFALAPIGAVDRMARMARKTLRSVIEEEFLLDAPRLYFTLGDPAGATTAGESSGNGRPPLALAGSGSAVVFGNATGPGTDGLTAAQFTSGQKYLAATNMSVPLGAGPMAVAFYFSTTATSGDLVSINDDAIVVQLDGAGHVRMVTSGGTVTSSAVVNDGATHCVVANLVGGGSSGVLYVDGVSSGAPALSGLTSVTSVRVGGAAGSAAATFTGAIAHVALFPASVISPRPATYYTAGLTGFAGETSTARIARLASYSGVASGDQVLEAAVSLSTPFVEISGSSPVAAINAVAQAEGGVWFIRGDGKFVAQNRQHRALQVVPDLGISNNEVDPSSRVVADMQLVQNVVTASAGSNGATQTAASSTSRGMHGDYPQDLSGLLVGSDQAALDAAQWRVAKYGEPFKRIPDLGLDLLTLTAAQQTSAMAVEISDRLQLSGLPSQVGGVVNWLDLIVEGWTESLSADSWDWQANTSNFAAASAWVLEDGGFGSLAGSLGVLDVTTILSY
ncbi:hypothetical protein [Nocardioides jejuensis]|uniref:Uncharacterized protein n=1 Tax=Nocardioides jejuensis TaxID=2502782 RepID=A0A4R1BZ80_9ACTN|nr:hypothetical protein [Nocardioides jejuensis]TCJ23017.1 hypothetical protein EPD65_11690 [Nocardioides jejuensis]